MTSNPEIEKAKRLAGGRMVDLAKLLGLHRTHCHRMYRQGHVSLASAHRAKSRFDELDVLALITPPDRSA